MSREEELVAPVRFEDVAPVVPVRNLQEALERYRKLGFSVSAYGHGTGYGFADRDGVSIHLTEWDEHDPRRTAAVVYLYVTDAEAVRSEWAGSGVEGRLGELFETDYDMREFGFVDADGTLHRVGSRMKRT
jgi:catechol 2,3-dioxygenase-like lactoylglutathione lyase family enzyme